MANEITLNPYEQAEGEFSAEELDSLAVGEQLAEQEQQLLAGKYKSAEELERGYLELQKRLSGKEEPEEEVQEEVQQDEQPEDNEEVDLYDTIMESYRTGEWDPEVVSKVEGMNPVDVANMFLEKGGATQAPQATSSDIEQIQESVGGTTEYQNMIQWAGQNLSEQEVAMYDAVMDRGDPLAMFFAAQALNARYQDAVGYDGEMLTGSAPRNAGDGFRSQAELVAAMSDPRYDKDPAYRADVADKLERSNIEF
ncbi:capsid assembly protein [Synechococcus phage DSL-LC07]|nr:capsid assembly protein [Synechococcus phage DSL-LC07]